MTVNWTHTSVGATAADSMNWTQCPEFTISAAFRYYMVTYVTMRVDISEVQAGNNQLQWHDMHVASD